MPFTAKDVFGRVDTILQDESHARWPLVELMDCINSALREITAIAPTACTDLVILPLVSGSVQTVPANSTRVLRVNANRATADAASVRTSIVRPVTRALLDAQIPGWQLASVYPFTKEVVHYVEDPNMVGEFLVFPGNLGTGFLECTVAKRPTLLTEPASPTLMDSWTAVVDLDERYFTALVDYVLHAALQKDIAVPAAAMRAAGYQQAFAAKMAAGTGTQVQGAATAGTGE